MADADYRQARTIATRTRLMRAMERLCAQHGAENVTVRAVVEAAGQKNESALQYHFKNREGLIHAIHKSRFLQTQVKRRESLTQCLANNSTPSVRDLCKLMVGPTFELCRSDAGYQQWIKAFGAINASVRHPMMEIEVIEESNSILIITRHLREQLPKLDETLFDYRYLTVVRLSGLSMSNHAKEKDAFQGPDSDFFISNLVDQLAGIFTAEISSETQALIKNNKLR